MTSSLCHVCETVAKGESCDLMLSCIELTGVVDGELALIDIWLSFMTLLWLIGVSSF